MQDRLLAMYSIIITRFALFAIIALAVSAPLCAQTVEPAPRPVVVALEAMNDADCAAAKRGDTAFFASTTAPEYVGINVDGSKDTHAQLLDDVNKPSGIHTTGCSTTVTKVTRQGGLYRLYGTYHEQGTFGPKNQHYRSIERIRDSWREDHGRWLQTESISYERTVWVDGKLRYHRVLPKSLGLSDGS